MPSASEDLHATLRHDVNNMLMVVMAGVDFLGNAIAELKRSEKARAPGELSVADLLDEATLSLDAIRQAGKRIGVAVAEHSREHRSVDSDKTPRESSHATRKPKKGAARKSGAGPSRCVLIIDDEEMVASALAIVLRGRGYRVATFLDARAALVPIGHGKRFDLILCDVVMPDMDGASFYEELCRVAPEQAQRVVFMTGAATTTRARRFLASVSQPILDKPFTAATLDGVVASLLPVPIAK